MTTWLEQTTRRKAIVSLVLFALALGVLGLAYWADADYWRALLHPDVLTAADLDEQAVRVNAYQGPSVSVISVNGKVLGNFGVKEAVQSYLVRSEVVKPYWAMQVGDRVLMVKSVARPAKTVTGLLQAIPSDLASDVFPKDLPADERAKFYPLMLDTDDLGTAETYLVYTLLVLAVFGTIAWIGWRRLRGKSIHPALKRAGGWGELHEVSSRIEREYQHETRLRMKGWRLTEHYLIYDSTFSFDVFRLDDLVWAYPSVVRHRYGGIIPIGKTHSAAMHFIDGDANAAGKETVVAEMLSAAQARAPWAIMGYSEQLSGIWKTQRPNFIDEVQTRKRERS
jgi:hypothetical protein